MKYICKGDMDIAKYIKISDIYCLSEAPISFNDNDSLSVLYNVIKIDSDYLKYCFDRIGITYDELYFKPSFAYKVNDAILYPSSLSSGERKYLYSLCCKRLGKFFAMYGVFESLSYENRLKYREDFRNYECVVVVMDKSMIENVNDILNVDEVVL